MPALPFSLGRFRAMAALAAGVGFVLPIAASAQTDVCEEPGYSNDREHHCEVRQSTVASSGMLTIDGGTNGGVRVVGTTRQDVLVVAEVWAYARSEERAREIAQDVEVRTEGDRLKAHGPSARRRESWGVTWIVEVPIETDLSIDTHNGGISIRDVDGHIRFDALNGGVRLTGLAGDVQGQTTNGGLHVQLDGRRWDGAEMDVKTTNGGVEITVPEGYSAQLETGTVNGGLNFDIPVTVRGRVDRRIRTQLGEGGPLVRAVTTNGSVRVRSGR